jgi:hypothetical protein
MLCACASTGIATGPDSSNLGGNGPCSWHRVATGYELSWEISTAKKPENDVPIAVVEMHMDREGVDFKQPASPVHLEPNIPVPVPIEFTRPEPSPGSTILVKMRANVDGKIYEDTGSCTVDGT